MDNYIGEIRPFAFGIVPRGWHKCDGSIIPVQQNQALFALIGNTYGGITNQSFALPDLRGRSVVGSSNNDVNYRLGIQAGAETVALTTNNIPAHTHAMEVSNNTGTEGILSNKIAIPTSPQSVSPSITADLYSTDTTNITTLASGMLDYAGGNVAHENMQPFLVVNYCIALVGNWPQRP
jgi:microcystin-dependent protein